MYDRWIPQNSDSSEQNLFSLLRHTVDPYSVTEYRKKKFVGPSATKSRP